MAYRKTSGSGRERARNGARKRDRFAVRMFHSLTNEQENSCGIYRINNFQPSIEQWHR